MAVMRDNFVFNTCFLSCGLVQYLFFSSFLERFQIFRNYGNLEIIESQIFVICVDMLLWSLALLMSKAWMILIISWSSKSTAEIAASQNQFISANIRLIIFNRCTLFSKVQADASLFLKISYKIVFYYELHT